MHSNAQRLLNLYHLFALSEEAYIYIIGNNAFIVLLHRPKFDINLTSIDESPWLHYEFFIIPGMFLTRSFKSVLLIEPNYNIRLETVKFPRNTERFVIAKVCIALVTNISQWEGGALPMYLFGVYTQFCGLIQQYPEDYFFNQQFRLVIPCHVAR